MCLTSELSLNMLSQLLLSVLPQVMTMHDNNTVCVYCAGDEPCSCCPVSQYGVYLCPQSTLQLPGDACTSSEGEGTLLQIQMPLCDIAVFSFLSFHLLD